MRIRATVVKALAAGALLAGVLGAVGAGSATALDLNNFYVATNGTNNVNNSCVNKATPCATIDYAMAQASVVNLGGPNEIHIAKGAYSGPNNVINDNATNTVIVGAQKGGKNKVTVTEPNPAAISDGGNAQVNDINIVGTGVAGEGMEVSGSASLNGDVYSAVGGAPAVGILALPGGTVTNSTVTGTVCTATTKTAIAASAPAGTLVDLTTKIPKCAGEVSAEHVTIGGIPLIVDSAGARALAIDAPGNGATAIPSSSTVSFAQTPDSYSNTGVVCDECTITGSTINGTAGLATTGIAVEGTGTSVVAGNKVNSNELLTGTPGGTGIALAATPGATYDIGVIPTVPTATADGNSGSGNYVGAAIGGGGGGTVNFENNSVGGASAGGAIVCSIADSLTVSDNTFSATAEEGAGLLLQGDEFGSYTGNTISGTLGLALSDGPGGCGGAGTNHNAFTSNSVSGLLFGTLILGPTDPVDVTALSSAFMVPASESGNEPNTFTSNTWTGSEAGLVDFNAYHGQVAPACGAVEASASQPAGTSFGPDTIDVQSASTCTLEQGTNLEDTNDPGHINQELYVLTATTLIGGSLTPSSVSVSNFIPLASTAFDAAPSVGLVAGDILATDQSPAGNATSVSSNVYVLNVGQPDINGSSSLDAITGSGGYDAA